MVRERTRTTSLAVLGDVPDALPVLDRLVQGAMRMLLYEEVPRVRTVGIDAPDHGMGAPPVLMRQPACASGHGSAAVDCLACLRVSVLGFHDDDTTIHAGCEALAPAHGIPALDRAAVMRPLRIGPSVLVRRTVLTRQLWAGDQLALSTHREKAGCMQQLAYALWTMSFPPVDLKPPRSQLILRELGPHYPQVHHTGLVGH